MKFHFSSRNDAFLSNAYLEEIEIESNPKLKDISLNAFSRLPYLKYLSLKNNSIDNILSNLDADDTGKTRCLKTSTIYANNNVLTSSEYGPYIIIFIF